jgi:hypothetical protein
MRPTAKYRKNLHSSAGLSVPAAQGHGESRALKSFMIQDTYKGIEIEMELHQRTDGWKCDYTLIKHPKRDITIHHAEEDFPTMELARESALKEARDAIDKAG